METLGLPSILWGNLGAGWNVLTPPLQVKGLKAWILTVALSQPATYCSTCVPFLRVPHVLRM